MAHIVSLFRTRFFLPISRVHAARSAYMHPNRSEKIQHTKKNYYEKNNKKKITNDAVCCRTVDEDKKKKNVTIFSNYVMVFRIYSLQFLNFPNEFM